MISIDYTLIVVILNFILLLVLLNAFLYKPLKKFLTERQQGIADDIKETKEAKMAAQEYIVKQEEEYKAAQQQIHKLMEQARKEAEKRSDEIIKQARAHEKDILVDTEKRLEHEKQKTIQSIEAELSVAVAKIAAKIIGDNIDEKIDADMISKLLKS